MALAVVTAFVVPAGAGHAQQAREGYARDAFGATNEQRADRGRAALDRQACVQRKAAQQARRMARQDRMFHQDLGPVLRDCRMRKVGENVAMGYPTGQSAVDDGWMRSRPHRRNLLDSDYRVMGLAARRSDDGQWYVAQVFGTR